MMILMMRFRSHKAWWNARIGVGNRMAIKVEMKLYAVRRLKEGDWAFTWTVHPSDAAPVLELPLDTVVDAALEPVNEFLRGDDPPHADAGEKPSSVSSPANGGPGRSSQNRGGGARSMVDTAEGATVEPGVRSTQDRPWSHVPLVAQAGILCNDPEFEEFLRYGTDIRPDEGTDGFVRRFCGVPSRNLIGNFAPSRAKWLSLVERFRRYQHEKEKVNGEYQDSK
jgi:hypothetical protein